MDILKKLLASVLITAFLVPLFPVMAPAADVAQNSKSISNDYMTFSVNDDTGFFSIATLDGHPQKQGDNNQNLLYDGDGIETSFTTVRIDGVDYIFGQDYGVFGLSSRRTSTTIDAVNNIVSTVWSIDGVTVTQKAVISRTDNTVTTGNVELKYEIENNSGRERQIGVRVMLDNAIGEIDAPVTMVQSELAPLARETEFFSNGRNPGAYIRYVDNYAQPDREAFVTFDSLNATVPSKMVVGHWHHLASNKWEYAPDTDFTFDSGFNGLGTADTATAIYFDEITYGDGQKNYKSILYGVGEFTAGYVDSTFNVTLDIEGDLEYENGAYKDDTLDAVVTIYNNVDGSEDIENAAVSLNCDSGLKISVPSYDGSTFVEVENYHTEIGFISKGEIQKYTFTIRVEVQEKLTILKTAITVEGNSKVNAVTAERYVAAPGKTYEKVPFAVTEIGSREFHIDGDRATVLAGTFPQDLMADKTKWSAAFVNRDNPEQRYEIDTDYITSTGTDSMSIQHKGPMMAGTYDLEFSFYDDYADVVGNSYTAPTPVSIVDDPSLKPNEYNIVAVRRKGTELSAKYTIETLSDEDELGKALKYIDANNLSTATNGEEYVVILRGSFVKHTDNQGNVIGYTANSDFTLNGVLTGRAGSSIEYHNHRTDDGNFEWDGVHIYGAGEALVGITPIFKDEWLLQLTNGFTYSLLTKNITLTTYNANSCAIDIVGGIANIKYGQLGKNAQCGYYISFGGQMGFNGYVGPVSASGNTVSDEGYDPSKTKKGFAMRHEFINASCKVSDIMFNSEGFYGIDTTLNLAISSDNIIRASRYDTFSVTLEINTIKKQYGGEITIPVAGGTITVRLILGEVKTKNWSVLLIDDLKIMAVIPPTNPIIIAPGVGITTLGGGFTDMLSLIPSYDFTKMTADEMVMAVNASTSEFELDVGFLFARIVSLLGILKVGVNHISLSAKISSPALPGISGVISAGISGKYYRHYDNGIEGVGSVTGYIKINGNVFSIIYFNGGVMYTGTDIVNHNPDVDGTNYGEGTLGVILAVPELIPVIGGMEIINAQGKINNDGIYAVGHILGMDYGVGYRWSDGSVEHKIGDEVMDLHPELQSASVVETTNLMSLPTETVSGEASLLSVGSNVSANITSADGSDNLLGAYFNGMTPGIDEIRFTVDGRDVPLKLASKDSGYSDGNCIIVPDNGNGGRIIISVLNPGAGIKNYTITSSNPGMRFSELKAYGLKRSPSVSEVNLNADGTVTVKGDMSLNGCDVNIYYAKSNETYDGIMKELVTNENGEKSIRFYKFENDQKVILEEHPADKAEAYLGARHTVNGDMSEVTLAPVIPDSLNSGEYYIMAVVTTPGGKVTKAYTENKVLCNNTKQPEDVAGAELVNAGDSKLRLNITNADGAYYDGYFVSIYNETDSVYVSENVSYHKGDEIIAELDEGKSYMAEIETFNIFDETNIVTSNRITQTSSVTVKVPHPIQVDFVHVGETRSAEYISPMGDVTAEEYLHGNIGTFKAISSVPVKGAFILDGGEFPMSEEAQNEHEITIEFDPGLHHISFKSYSEDGDTYTHEGVVIAVSGGAPALLIEDAAPIIDQNGKFTLRGYAKGAKTVELAGVVVSVQSDGRFEISAPVETQRFAQRYEITATAHSGESASASVLAVNTDYKPIDRIELVVDGVSSDNVNAGVGENINISIKGYAGEREVDVSETAVLKIVQGNNVAVLNEDGTLKAVSPGKAYVKAVYDMGTYIKDDRTANYTFEDMLEVDVRFRASDVKASIPNGAAVEKGDKLTLSADGDIYYTTDGSDPTKDSILYTDPIKIEKDITIKARNFRDGYDDSYISEFRYKVRTSGAPSGSSSSGGNASMSFGTVALVATDGSSYLDYGSEVVLTAPGGGKIFYTTDGTTPNKDSIPYTGPIVLTDDTVITATVWNEGDVYSPVYTYNYKLNPFGIRLRNDAAKSDLIKGYPDSTFRPDVGITRAETAALLRRASYMYGFKIREDMFSDVDMWAKQYICELASASVITGYPDGTFRPDNSVTRGEFVTMLMRIIGASGSSTDFVDVQGHWAEKYIAKAVEYGYVNGYPDSTFRPDANITRAEAMKIMAVVFGFDTENNEGIFTDVSPDHWAYGYIA